MESATNAIRLLVGDIATQVISFEELQFQSPLGLDPSRELELQFDELVSSRSWKFVVRSISPSSTTLVHCVGVVSLSLKINLATYGRLVDGAVRRVQGSETAESFMADTAYGLFTKVMHYEPFFQGIQSMRIDREEAIASISLPSNQPGRMESPGWTRCDAVLVDCFRSVVGLLPNSSKDAAENQIVIAVGIERVILTTSCHADSRFDWSVYAKFMYTANKQLVGDVFVRAPDNRFVAMMAGVQFNRLDMVKLTRLLRAANVTPSQTQRNPTSEALYLQQSTPSNSPMTYPVDSSATVSTTIVAPPEEEHESPDLMVKSIISNYTGLGSDDILANIVLADLGIDSLSLVEFSEEINTALGLELLPDDLIEMTLDGLVARLGKKARRGHILPPGADDEAHQNVLAPLMVPNRSDLPTQPALDATLEHIDHPITDTDNPFQALLLTDSNFHKAAQRHGYGNYVSSVLPRQDLLVLAYILEAFQVLGIDVLSFSPGTVVPHIPHIPTHERLVSRLWDTLETHGIVSKQTSIIVRGRKTLPLRPATDMYAEFIAQFPAYLPEAKLMKLAGERLARCLKGEIDPVALMFGSRESYTIMEEYYANSPMLSTLTDQLVDLVINLLRQRTLQTGRTVRILEVGAGTGGTTLRLAPHIEAAGIRCQYTFSDISMRFLTKAKMKLGAFTWIEFATFDLEKEVHPTFSNSFDIIISTNCVHATSSRVQSCSRIRDCLTDDGVAILSEATHPLAWFDITFGLLDGWWVAENGTEYPLQPASKWMEVFREAGFASSAFSQGTSREACLQQLLVACKKTWPIPGLTPLARGNEA
ncbi:hypothetical protein BJY00DRAFT_315854 [Aspergillus carlsbadensis]|nr:hypothetical protein BJY00DRAFT_315854 [Aspergillus carlsbadensis]